jgi:DNA-directed RNA polymerase specialized sigma24 family protein
MPISGEKVKHDDLFQGILETLQEWPYLDQQILIQAHYGGQSIEKISRSFSLDTEEVRLILQHRDLKLYAALRRFREAGCGESLPFVIQPPDPAACRLMISGCNF